MGKRTVSDPAADPTTGADLGAARGTGRTKTGDMGGTPDIASAPAMAEATIGRK